MRKVCMEKNVARPKNEHLGKPPLSERVPVLLTKDQHEIIKAAAERAGLGPSTYMRTKALEAAMKDG